jgi:hypothetical protein
MVARSPERLHTRGRIYDCSRFTQPGNGTEQHLLTLNEEESIYDPLCRVRSDYFERPFDKSSLRPGGGKPDCVAAAIRIIRLERLNGEAIQRERLSVLSWVEACMVQRFSAPRSD